MNLDLFADDKRIAKAETWRVLDALPAGYRFSSIDLQRMVERRIGQVHLTDTYIRYVREYRKDRGRRIPNVDKKRSLYEVGA